MGAGLEHEITSEYGRPFLPTFLGIIRYGKCLHSPYVENDLWFVTVPQGVGSYNTSATSEMIEPDEPHTFLVDKEYANPIVINERRRDVAKWRAVAHKIFVGRWCEHLECLWQDVPVYTHELPNGNVVKYGYCSTQLHNNPNRELYFVSFKYAPYNQHAGTYVVDKFCTEPAFLNRMGDDQMKWELICLGKLTEEVQYDKLQTGTLDGGYVRSHHFALDSPYPPPTAVEAQRRIPRYEQALASERSEHERRTRGLFSREKRWEDLSPEKQAWLMAGWTRRSLLVSLESADTTQ